MAQLVGTVGCTPGSGWLVHTVLERLVFSIGFMMILVYSWCPPTCGVVSVAVLAYRICIILLMASYLVSP